MKKRRWREAHDGERLEDGFWWTGPWPWYTLILIGDDAAFILHLNFKPIQFWKRASNRFFFHVPPSRSWYITLTVPIWIHFEQDLARKRAETERWMKGER